MFAENEKKKHFNKGMLFQEWSTAVGISGSGQFKFCIVLGNSTGEF